VTSSAITAAVPVTSLVPPSAATVVAALIEPPPPGAAPASPEQTTLDIAATPAGAAPTVADLVDVAPRAERTVLADPIVLEAPSLAVVEPAVEPAVPIPDPVATETRTEAPAVIGAPAISDDDTVTAGRAAKSTARSSKRSGGSSRSAAAAAVPIAESAVAVSAVAVSAGDLPFSADELCAAASITAAQLADLVSFGIVSPRGLGADATYVPASVEIATIAGRFLDNGIDARHLRSWRQAAEREAALFEQRIMPLLRQRNPQSRQAALDTLSELASLGDRLHASLVGSLLRHHFD
jgi:hypothetical protein